MLVLAVSADFGSAAPVIRETKALISDKLGRKFETSGASGGSVEEGSFSDGFDKVSAGIFSDGVAGAAVVLSLGAVSSVDPRLLKNEGMRITLDNHNLGIGRLRELKRRFDTAPT